MAHGLEMKELPARRVDVIPGAAKLAVGALLVLGVIAFGAVLLWDAERAWRAYMFNWLYFQSVAQGAVLLAAVVLIARGVWARPFRRIALSPVAYLPLSFVLLLPLLLFGTSEVFEPWLTIDLHGKEVWLNVPFLAARNLVLLAALLAVSLAFAYWALRPDAGLHKADAPDRVRGWYDRLTGRWRGQEAEEARAAEKQARIGPAFALIYSITMGIVAWDFVMSLDPHWFSTLFGPYFFMGGFLGGVALTALLSSVYRITLDVEDVITGDHLHDLGKLTFAFCIFWAYLFWAQYIVIWYGKIPYEQIFLIHRMTEPYALLSLLVLLFLFVVPFIGLIGVKPKRTPAILGTFASVILLGLWIERFILVYPSYYQEEESMLMSWPEIGTGFLFAGLFLASILYFVNRFSIFQVWEPLVHLDLPEEEEAVAART